MESMQGSKKEFGYKSKHISQGVGYFCGKQSQKKKELHP